MGREVEYPLTPDQVANLARLLESLNKFRSAYGKPMLVTSGYRPGRYNVQAGGASNSAHLTCEACDFADPEGLLDEFCSKNTKLLDSCGLWLEHPDSTPGWTHLDIRARKNRIFRP